MSKQPTALADALDAEVVRTVALDLLHTDAANTIRRLHALLVEAKPMLEEFGGTPAYDLIDRIDALGEGEKK